jgi:hypothetical protein
MTEPATVSPRLTRICAWLCLLAAVGLPALTAGFWLTGAPAHLYAATFGAGVGGLPPAPSLAQRAMAAAIMLIPVLALSRGLVCARRSLGQFAGGAFFGARAIDGLRGLACWGFGATLGSVAAPILVGLALSADNPPGQRVLAVSVSSDQLLGLLVCGLFWIIAGVMVDARRLADENRQFV